MSFKPKAWLFQFLNCVSFLTRIPIPKFSHSRSFSLKDCIWCFAPVGLLIGGTGVLSFIFVTALGLHLLLSVLVSIGVTIIVSGALHEDGFADFCDGLGVHERAKALEAMRDSRIGAFGVIGLVFSLAWRAGALYQLSDTSSIVIALFAAHAGGRGMIAPLFLLPFAGQTGLAYAAGSAGRQSVLIGLIFTGIILFALLPFWTAFFSLIIGLLVAGLIGLIAMKKFGGVTGDVYGAAEQGAEMAVLGILLSAL